MFAVVEGSDGKVVLNKTFFKLFHQFNEKFILCVDFSKVTIFEKFSLVKPCVVVKDINA